MKAQRPKMFFQREFPILKFMKLRSKNYKKIHLAQNCTSQELKITLKHYYSGNSSHYTKGSELCCDVVKKKTNKQT